MPPAGHALARLVGAKVALLRRLRDLQQFKLAERAGITKGYLSALEAGKKIPSLAMVLTLAEALGVEPRDLFPTQRQAGRPTQRG